MFGDQQLLNIVQLHLFNILLIVVDVDDVSVDVNDLGLHKVIHFVSLETGVWRLKN